MRRTPKRCRGAVWLVAAAALLPAAACTSNDTAIGPPPLTSSGQYWALTLDYHAVTLSSAAPYDTLRLTATARDADGNPISGLEAPVFASADIQHVQVDSTGLVHALGDVTLVPIAASVSNGTLTHVDTAWVSVVTVPQPPVLARLSIHPGPGDSAETSLDLARTLVPVLLDGAGDTLGGLAVSFASSNRGVATVDPTAGTISGVSPGRTTIIAVATAYGVTRADTLPFVIGWPTTTLTSLGVSTVEGKTVVTFGPKITIGTGGAVIWVSPLGAPATDIVFDDSLQVDSASNSVWCTVYPQVYPGVCGSGNIAPFYSDSAQNLFGIRARAFPVAGIYHYHSTEFGTTGEVDVIDWRTIQ